MCSFKVLCTIDKRVLCRTAETHELAKRKASEMDKIRNAFGLDPEAKEGQAFDRDLQERLKAERIAEREAQQKAREKEAKKKEKERKKKEKEQKKLNKKKEKENKKAALLKEKVGYAACRPKLNKEMSQDEICLSGLTLKTYLSFKLLYFAQVSAQQESCPSILGCHVQNSVLGSQCKKPKTKFQVLKKLSVICSLFKGEEGKRHSEDLSLIPCILGKQEDKKYAEEREERRAKKARQEAEAKEKRQKDLQARLGSRVLAKEEKRSVLQKSTCPSPSVYGECPALSLCT